MNYLGDRRLSDIVDLKFFTTNSSGAPTALVGGVISVYKDNSVTESTAGVTLTSPFDSRTGMHHVRITTATDATFYSAGSDFMVVITTGTVNAVSVVGTIIAEFSIENRSAVMPTTATRKLDVSAGGEAGVDWANVGSPTTTLDLSGTTIKTSQVVASVTGAVGSVTGAVGSVTGAVGSVTGAVGSVAGNVGGNVVGTVASVVGAVGSVAGNVAGSVGSVVGAVGSVTGAVGSVGAGGIAASTFAAGAVDAAALSADAGAEIADAILNRNMATGTDSGSDTVRTVRQALRALRNKWAVSAGTYTSYKEDDSTTNFTSTVTGTAGADPLTASDPAGP